MAFKFLGLLAVILHSHAAARSPPGPATHHHHPQFLQHHGEDKGYHDAKHEVKAKQGISPDLEPVSDEKFFKKDYPDDSRPGPYNHFKYPYPEVQDSDHYDRDYVEDRNDDGGYWKAQMEYDGIRNKLTIEKEQLRRALAKEQKEKKELEEAIAAEKKAENERMSAEKVEDKAETDHAKALKELNELKKDISHNADATDKEVTDLEDCKKQLEEAKQKLKAELEKKKEREAEQKKREATERATEGEEIKAMKTEAELEELLKKEQVERDLAKEAYDKELAELKKAEEELDAAYLALSKLRRADPDGGVYEVAKGGAHQGPAMLSVVLVLTIAQIFLK